MLLINIFSCAATGGAVVALPIPGAPGKRRMPAPSAQQLVATIAILALAIMGVSLAAKDWLLRLIFGGIEADVMRNAQIYFLLSALSYPFLAIYNAGAALFRSMGNSKISLETSVVMNLINVIGNADYHLRISDGRIRRGAGNADFTDCRRCGDAGASAQPR